MGNLVDMWVGEFNRRFNRRFNRSLVGGLVIGRVEEPAMFIAGLSHW